VHCDERKFRVATGFVSERKTGIVEEQRRLVLSKGEPKDLSSEARKPGKGSCISMFSYFLELLKWVGTREPTQLTTGLGRVWLKYFYQFQYGLIFDLAHPG